MSADINTVINFLTSLFNNGLSYSAINTAQSALSSLLMLKGVPVGSNPLVVRLLKGIFNLRPSIPKTIVTWDTDILLNYLRKLSPVRTLTLKMLSMKTAALLWILTSQRSQSMQMLDVRNLTVSDHSVKIRFGDTLKTTRPGFHQKEISVKAYAPDRRLCIVTVLREYLSRTKVVRKAVIGKTQLFLSYNKPFEPVSRETIARWIRFVMLKAGLDVSMFTPHSIRAASTSAACRYAVPMDTILNTAGWKNDCTFRKYYNKPLKVSDTTVGNSLLVNSKAGAK